MLLPGSFCICFLAVRRFICLQNGHRYIYYDADSQPTKEDLERSEMQEARLREGTFFVDRARAIRRLANSPLMHPRLANFGCLPIRLRKDARVAGDDPTRNCMSLAVHMLSI